MKKGVKKKIILISENMHLIKVTFSDEPGQNLNWFNPHNMMVEVMSNQASILDFPKGPHILSVSHLKYQSSISVYTFEFQNGLVMTSLANQLAI